jgi:hypothetical protein
MIQMKQLFKPRVPSMILVIHKDDIAGPRLPGYNRVTKPSFKLPLLQ